MATKASLAQSEISRIETNATMISLDVLDRLCRALKCKPGDSWCGRGSERGSIPENPASPPLPRFFVVPGVVPISDRLILSRVSDITAATVEELYSEGVVGGEAAVAGVKKHDSRFSGEPPARHLVVARLHTIRTGYLLRS